jgi:lipopolysaccharide biosynthesis glycosyltransferase
MKESIWVGFDPREAAAFAVAVHSIKSRLSRRIPVYGLVLKELQASGLYRRPTDSFINSEGHKQLIDVLSARDDYNGAMSTEFAISRFLVPHLAGSGWALFMDCDMLARSDLTRLFALRDPSKAVMCVQHQYAPIQTVKMDGQLQTKYSRKNWSSVMLFNCDHPANERLTLDMVNKLPGRDLHALCWLKDDEIGALPIEWNWLAGESEHVQNPRIVHHTLGSPCMSGYEDAPYANEWRDELAEWALQP